MAFVSSINGVAHVNQEKRGCFSRGDDPFLGLYRLSVGRSQRHMKRRHCLFTTLRAASVNPEVDFSDPNWKEHFQLEFEKRFNLPHLRDVSNVKPILTTFSLKSRGTQVLDGATMPDDRKNEYINDNDRTLLKVIKYSSPASAGAECIDPNCSWVEQWVHRAGPRKRIYFEPGKVKAGIVTCGGLCPGLNDVIRQIVFTLELYGVKKIIGIPFGYHGFFDQRLPEIQLSRNVVQNINLAGGSLLGVSRGGANISDIVDSIQARGIDMLFILGGNGTHAGANAIHNEVFREDPTHVDKQNGEAMQLSNVTAIVWSPYFKNIMPDLLTSGQAVKCCRRMMRVSIVCVPKTIDNDILLMDKTFGFDTAVEEAQRAINSAYIEAHSAYHGIGVVKLMGRSSGFIAMHASLSSGQIDICLIPEVPFSLEGRYGVLQHLENLIKIQGSAVICVAEGAGQDLLEKSNATDASGNVVLGDIGVHIQQQIKMHFKAMGIPADVKYIDPTYMIRACRPNASDAILCTVLGQNAVHGAFAGFSGITVGLCNTHYVYLPISEVITTPRCVDPNSRMWHRCLTSTGQPDFY